MRDIDARRADIAQSRLPRTKAEFDVLVIAARVELRQRSYPVEAGARDVETEADAVGHVDGRSFVRCKSGFGYVALRLRVRQGVDNVGLGKACEFAVVGERRDCAYVFCRARDCGESADCAGSEERVGIEKKRVAPLAQSQSAVDGRRETEIDLVVDRLQTSASGLTREKPADRFVGRGVVDGDHAHRRSRAFREQRFKTRDRRVEIFVYRDDHIERRCLGICPTRARPGRDKVTALELPSDAANDLAVESQSDRRVARFDRYVCRPPASPFKGMIAFELNVLCQFAGHIDLEPAFGVPRDPA